jgi:hypothetical protein
MFERNKVDTGVNQQTAVPAEVELDDGVLLSGKFVISASRGFFDVLNGPSLFLEFEPYGEDRLVLSKSAIRAMKLIQVPGAPSLANRAKVADGFDPFAVLGVEKGAAWDSVREAFVRLSKHYHPDRYESVDLPTEVRDYLQAMSRRVNTAYASLEKANQAEKLKVSKRVEPVYTSQPR